MAGAGPGRGGGPAQLGRVDGRITGRTAEHTGQQRVGRVVAQQVRGDPVRDGQHPGQGRPFGFADLQ